MGKHTEHLQKLSNDLENVMLRGVLENGGGGARDNSRGIL